jgi:hypothetical protein
MTDFTLIERLQARADEDRKCADNAAVLIALLQPEVDKFDARESFNLYAVRMSVDHSSGLKKDIAYANDLEEAIQTILDLKETVKTILDRYA